MTLEASGTLAADVKIQYLCTLVRGEALRQLDTLSVEVRSTNSENLKYIILGLGTYLFPVNVLSKQKRTMRHGMRKPRGLKLRCYVYCMIDIDNYLDVFTGAKASDNFF